MSKYQIVGHKRRRKKSDFAGTQTCMGSEETFPKPKKKDWKTPGCTLVKRKSGRGPRLIQKNKEGGGKNEGGGLHLGKVFQYEK